MKREIGIVSITSDFDKVYNINRSLFDLISKKNINFFFINIENIVNNPIEKSHGLPKEKIPKNFIFFSPKNINEFEDFFKNKRLSLILNFGRKLLYFKVLRIFKKYDVKLAIIQDNSGYGNKFTENFLKSNNSNLNFSIKKNLNYYLYRILVLFNTLPQTDIFFLSDDQAKDQLKKSFPAKIEKLFPSMKFSLFKRIELINKKSIINNFDLKKSLSEEFIVFVDSQVDSGDIVVRDGPITEKNQALYFMYLKKFLEKLSTHFEKKVVVCLHPKSNENLYNKYLGNFKLEKYKTREYIEKSFLVTFHESTAITDAIYLKKRIIRLNTNLLGSYLSKRITLYDKYNFLTIDLIKEKEAISHDLLELLDDNVNQYQKHTLAEFKVNNEALSKTKILEILSNDF